MTSEATSASDGVVDAAMCDTAGTANSGRPKFGIADTGWIEPGTLLGDWRIERIIGLGGMGTVYEAVHVLIGKRAAIKVVRADMTPQTAERFVREAWVVNQIHHPNVVDIFEIGHLEDKRPYLVMELLEGKNLEERMDAGRIPPVECVEILLQMCSALQAAHDHNVIHRDLKPANIVLSIGPNGEQAVKLVDWGIARITSPALGERPSRTISGTLLGTPEHMSPEQARGQNDVDGRADIYALGSIAYEMFLEGPPFSADSVAELLTMHLRQPPPPPSDVWPDIPVALERILLQMLAKAPEDRPTLAQISETLTAVREELQQRRRLPTSSRRTSLAEYMNVLLPRRRTTRSLTYVAALGIAAAALVFGRAANARGVETPAQATAELELASPLEAFGRMMPALLPPAQAETATAATTTSAPIAPKTGEPDVPSASADAPRIEPAAEAPLPTRPSRASVRRRSAPPIDPDGTIDPFL